MHALKLRVQALRAARCRSRAAQAQPCHLSEGRHNNVGVTAGKTIHNASIDMGVTAGKIGRNSSEFNKRTIHQHSNTECIIRYPCINECTLPSY